jgi:hypothetical protein
MKADVSGVTAARRTQRGLGALFGYLGVLVRVRAPLFLRDKPLDQVEKAVIEIRVRDGLAFDDTQDLGRARRHRDGRRTDSRARGLFHFLQFAFLAFGRRKYDAGSVAIVGAGRLQTHGHIYLVRRLEIPSAGQDPRFARSIQHVALAEQRTFNAPTHSVAGSGNRLRERSGAGKGARATASRFAEDEQPVKSAMVTTNSTYDIGCFKAISLCVFGMANSNLRYDMPLLDRAYPLRSSPTEFAANLETDQ